MAFLQHGLVDSADSWIINEENLSPGFMFANAGYDVWLGNFRGNTYSKKHEVFHPKERQFWDFCFDDHALDDLPTMIKFVYAKTEQKINYIGHSMGCGTLFAALSVNVENINSMIRKFVALGPSVFPCFSVNNRRMSNWSKDIVDLKPILETFRFLDLISNISFIGKVMSVTAIMCPYLIKLCFKFGTNEHPDLDNIP